MGIGTEIKKNRIKKTYAPGPGSYDLPTSVGHIPIYLRNGNKGRPGLATASQGSRSRFGM
jgi:hypothetical protein